MELGRKDKLRLTILENEYKFLRNVLESLNHPFYVIDVQSYKIKMFNSHAIKNAKEGDLTCYSLSHQSDSPCNTSLHPCPIEEVKKTKTAVVVEHEHISQDGEKRIYEVHGCPIFDDAGNVVEMIEYTIDITDRKISEKALKESEAKNRKFFTAIEQSGSTIVITDKRGSIEYVNPKFFKTTGYSLEEVTGKNPRVLASKEIPREVYRELWKTIKSGKEWHGEFKNRKKNGELYWESATISPIFNEAGEITHFVAIKEDISDRKIMLEAMNYHLEFNKLLVDLAIDFVKIPLSKIDELIEYSLGKIGQFLNMDYAYLLKYDYEEGLARITNAWPDLNIEPDFPMHKLQELIEIHKKGDISYVKSTAELSSDAWIKQILQKHHIKSMITIPLNDQSNCYGFIGFASIHSERAWDEREIALFQIMSVLFTNAEIRRKHEAMLIKTRKMAETANQIKSNFLANMSHEIRTPMNAIINYADLTLKTSLSSLQREYVQNIRGSSKLLLGIFNDILDFSKMKSGEISIEASCFSLRDLLQDMKMIFYSQVQEKELDLQVDIDKNLPPVLIGDPLRLRQILINLAGNAVKYTERGQIRIKAKLFKQLPDDKLKIRFVFKDTGIGMTSTQISQLFKPFSQVDASFTRRFGGTGLGLSISKYLIEMMDGHIKVKSKPGKGSIFSFIVTLGYTHSSFSNTDTFVSVPKAMHKENRGLEKKYIEEEKRQLQEAHKAFEETNREIKELQHYQLPRQLPGIHVEEGLSRWLGDEEMYRDILIHVYKTQSSQMESILEALSKGEYHKAKHIAHTLKGIAGNISALRLYESAGMLEEALINNKTHGLKDLLKNLDEDLKEVLQGCEELAKNASALNRPSAIGTGEDYKKIKSQLDVLASALKDRNPIKSAKIIKQLKALHWSSNTLGMVSQLSSLISEYEFEKAWRLVNDLKEILSEEFKDG